jgi:mRNA interferase RelE/StbE
VYQVLLSRETEKFLSTLQKSDKKLFNRFIDAFTIISNKPYTATALVGNLKGYYSYRVGDYRIIYEIIKQKLLVYIEKVAHRKEVYK